MESIEFTTRVLGPLATVRLENNEITQTLRSPSDTVSKAFLGGRLKIGDQIRIILDQRMIGMAYLYFVDMIDWQGLDENDARRGGFDTKEDLLSALQRAGYRFLPMEIYRFYRIQFTWLKADEAEGYSSLSAVKIYFPRNTNEERVYASG